MSHRLPMPGARDGLPAMAMWAAVAVLFANAVVHVLAVCMPLIASDYWNHIDPFLRDAVEGRLDAGNFFVQRAGTDHAQPLNKLVMWANLRWFGLDFLLEGLLGMAFGLLALLLLWRLARAGAGVEPAGIAERLAFVAVAAVFFSLNSSFIYSYSMVTLWFALYLSAFLVALGAWHAVVAGRRWPLAVATLVLGLIADDSAFLDVAAVSLALLLWAARTRAWRAPLQAIAVMLLVLLACRGVYAVLGETSGSTQALFDQPTGVRLQRLAAQWRDAWQWFAIPASAGLAAPEALHRLFGGGWPVARQVLAMVLLAAHAWFWWAALRVRPRGDWLAAVVLMAMFYAHVGAILLARVFAKGAVYLEQPRYVSFYQFGIMALLLMGMAMASARGGRRAPAGLAAVAVAILVLQVPLTGLSKQREPHAIAYNLRMAADMAAVARDPANPPVDCRPAMDLCVLPLAKRIELATLLREHRINLFSPAFAQRHPDMASAAGLAPAR